MSNLTTPIFSFLLGFLPVAVIGGAFAWRVLGWRNPKPWHLIAGATSALGVYSFIMTIIGFVGGLKYSFAVTLILDHIFIFTIVIYRIKLGWKTKRPPLLFTDWKPSDKYSLILMWAVIIFQFSMFVASIAPEINQDNEVAHYLFVKDAIELGKLSVNEENAFSYYPMAIEMMIFNDFQRAKEHGPEAANMCYWFMQLLLILWIVDFCGRRGRPGLGWHLAAIVCGTFYWPVLTYSGFLDIPVTLFSIASILTYFDFLESRISPRVAMPLTGLFLGIAIAGKYSSLMAAIFIVLHLSWIILTDKRRKEIIKPVLMGFLAGIAVIAPWFIRNYLETGNPVFPFLRGVFGGPELTLADDISTWSSWGLPLTLKNYLIYPLKLSFFYPLENVPIIRVPYLYMNWLFALAPLAGIMLLHRRVERITAVWCFLFFNFAFFMMNLQTRYFIPFQILALWLVSEWLWNFRAIGKSDELSESEIQQKNPAKLIASLLVFLLALIPLLTQIDLVRNHLKVKLPYLSGQISRDDYERRLFPGAVVFDAANQAADEDNKVCIFSLRTYRLNVPYIFPPTDIFATGYDPTEHLSGLKNKKVSYILVETRIRSSAEIIAWSMTQFMTEYGVSSFKEKDFLDAMGDIGISRKFAREIVQHLGGKRIEDHGEVKISIDLNRFNNDRAFGIIRFLSEIDSLKKNGLIQEERITKDWELYKINYSYWNQPESLPQVEPSRQPADPDPRTPQ